MDTYVYGVVAAGGAKPPSAEGVDGQRVELVEEGATAALVSDAPTVPVKGNRRNLTDHSGVLQEVVPLPTGARLEGSYSVSNTSNFGGVQAAGGNIWKFHANGTFEHETFGGVATTPHVTGTGSAPGNAAGVANEVKRGTYAFGPGTLTLTGDGGATETHSAWNIGDHSPPWYIHIDGLTFKGSL